MVYRRTHQVVKRLAARRSAIVERGEEAPYNNPAVGLHVNCIDAAVCMHAERDVQIASSIESREKRLCRRHAV